LICSHGTGMMRRAGLLVHGIYSTMPTPEENFANDVFACIEEINSLLPELAQRYSDLTMAAALAQHVGGALRLFLRRGICTREQAQRVIGRMRLAAFPEPPPLEG
jgi:hypothetical protein